MRRYQRLPSDARQIIVQQSPTPRVTFFMPSRIINIRRYNGTGRRGRLIEGRLLLPQMMYTWDPGGSRQLKIYIPRITGSRILASLSQLANIYGDGRICWGSEPSALRDTPASALSSYWDSTFNDDLTPYGEFEGDISWGGFYREYGISLDSSPLAWVTQLPRISPQTNWYSIFDARKRENVNKIADKIEKLQSLLGANPDDGFIPTGLYYILARQQSMGSASVRVHHRIVCLERLIARLGEEQEHQNAARNLANAHCLATNGVIHNLANELLEESYYSGASFEWEDVVDLTIQRIRSELSTAWAFIHRERMVGLYLEYVKFLMYCDLVNRAEERLREGYQDDFDEWVEDQQLEWKNGWWEGKWQDFSPYDDMTEYICGTSFQNYESLWGIYYQPVTVRTYQGQPFGECIKLPLSAGIYPIFATPQPRTVVTIINQVPLVGTIDQKIPDRIEWEVYDENLRDLNQELEAIFS